MWQLALLGVLLVSPAHGEQSVPLVNASFDQQTPNDTAKAGAKSVLPPGWSLWLGQAAKAAGATMRWEPSSGRNQTGAAAFRGFAGSGCLMQFAPVEAGRTYLCSVWAKRSNPRSRCALAIRWAKADRSWANPDSVAKQVPETLEPGQWVRLDLPIAVPDGAARAVIQLTAGDQQPDDVCWFDDVELVALEPGAIVVSPLARMHPNLQPVGEPAVTPHVAWAKPLAGGPIRVLFFCKGSDALREPLELAQRLEMQCDSVIVGHDRAGWYALNADVINKRLRERFYDVIVVSAARIPEPTLGYLAGHAKGLVFVRPMGRLPKEWNLAPPDSGHLLLQPQAALPEATQTNKDGTSTKAPAIKSLRCGSLGNSRVVELNYTASGGTLTPDIPFDEHLALGACYWEAYLQLVGRNVLWAAGRELPVETDARFDNGVFFVSASSAAAFSGTLEVLVADAHNTLVRVPPGPERQAMRIEPGKSFHREVPLPPHLPGGAVTCLVILRDGTGRVAGFAAARGTVDPPNRILAIRTDRPYYDEGQEVRLAIHLRLKAENLRVRAVMADVFGRVHARQEVPAASPTVHAVLSPAQRLSAMNWVTVDLLDGSQAMDSAKTYVLVPMSREAWLADYQVGTWHNATAVPPYAQATLSRMTRELQITEGLQGGRGYLTMLAAGLWPISFAYSRVPAFHPHGERDSLRKPCFSDPTVRQQMADIALRIAQEERPFRPLWGYLHDETGLVGASLDQDVCSCPHCQDRYRVWLKDKYGSLEALNRQWRSAFRSWSDVAFVTYHDVRGKSSYAPWLMYRSFMDMAWAEAVDWTKRHARQSDPGVRLALPNTFGPNPFSGRDYELLGQANDYWMEYNHETRSPLPRGAIRYNFDAVRSFAPGVPNHPWIGYRFDDETIRFAPWWTALHGASGVAPYGTLSLSGPTGSWAMIFPTLQNTRRGSLYAEEFRALRAGIGKLLINARRTPAPIAILWSQPSMYVAWAMSDQDKGPASLRPNSYGQYFQSRLAFRQSVLAGGRQFDYLSERQILAGALDDYGGLALPACYAVGEDLAKKLEAFVERGGKVVADMGCGLTNEVGTRCDQPSPAERLFGFRRRISTLSYEDRKTVLPLGFHGDLAELACTGAEEIDARGDSRAVKDASGRTCAVAQAWPSGGATLLLNCVAPYAPELVGLWNALPQIARVTSTDGTRSPTDYELVLLESGAERYLGVLHSHLNDEPNYPVCVKLAQRAHLYDVRRGDYVGLQDTLTMDLPPGGCNLYALLPSKRSAVRLEGGSTQAGQACKLRCTVTDEDGKPSPGRQVLRLELRDPSGTVAEHYSQNVLTENGRADPLIPFALSDMPGTWTVTVRDVATGVRATASIGLR